MKNIISLVCLALLVSFTAAAQNDYAERYEATNKKGQNILPAKGDFAITIDAAPLFDFIGNMFNGNTGNTSPVVTGHSYQVYGKYFLKDREAIRFGLTVNTDTDVYKALVKDNSQSVTDPQNPNKTLVDSWTKKTTDFQFAAGYEFRRGYKRLQAFYGAEFIFGVNSGSDTYDYANAFTSINKDPDDTNFNGNLDGSARVTSIKGGSLYKFGLGLFIGAEYFFAPKMAINGELGLRAGYGFYTQRVTTKEMYDSNLGGVQVIETRSRAENGAASSEANLWTNPTGCIGLSFYF